PRPLPPLRRRPPRPLHHRLRKVRLTHASRRPRPTPSFRSRGAATACSPGRSPGSHAHSPPSPSGATPRPLTRVRSLRDAPMTTPLTSEELRARGMEVLVRELGYADALRFIQQFDLGRGDYAKERHTMLPNATVNDL